MRMDLRIQYITFSRELPAEFYKIGQIFLFSKTGNIFLRVFMRNFQRKLKTLRREKFFRKFPRGRLFFCPWEIIMEPQKKQDPKEDWIWNRFMYSDTATLIRIPSYPPWPMPPCAMHWGTGNMRRWPWASPPTRPGGFSTGSASGHPGGSMMSTPRFGIWPLTHRR